MFKKKTKETNVEEQPAQPPTQDSISSLGDGLDHGTEAKASHQSNDQNNDKEAAKEGFFGRMKRKTANAGYATKLQAYKTKKQTQNQLLKKQLADRKRQFGEHYIDLCLAGSTPQRKQDCLAEALEEIKEIQQQIDQNIVDMENKEEKYKNEKIVTDPNGQPGPEQPVDKKVDPNNDNKSKLWQPRKKKEMYNPNQIYYPEPLKEDPYEQAPGSPRQQMRAAQQHQHQHPNGGRGGPPPGRSGRGMVPGRGPPGRGGRVPPGRGHPPHPAGARRGSTGGAPPPHAPGRGPPSPHGRGRGAPHSPGRSSRGLAAAANSVPPARTAAPPPPPLEKTAPTTNLNKLGLLDCKAPTEYTKVDASQWTLSELNFGGATSYQTVGVEEKVEGKSITEAIKYFKANPHKYTALYYQASMLDWPVEKQQYTLVHREGTEGFEAKNPTPQGWMTMLKYDYYRLPPLKDNVLPKTQRDKYTDKMVYGGKKLHSKKNPPILPGRGMGVGDTPLLKIIGDVDPSDIHQGQVGDCWLLSAISAVAEFDGAIKRLYRKTKNLEEMPFSDKPNMYTITLWDLTTWKEVDIEVDERLCAAPDGRLLASKPSEDGELWVCYIEKAIAIHAGGWDKLVGGQCTHAWALMTGCKNQYTIMKNKNTGKFRCYGRYNVNEDRWAKHGNSPHDGELGMWPMPWPDVGGGGDANLELSEDELFLRLVAWDQVNYIVGAGTDGKSDKNSTGGLIDNHAYSVIESRDNVCGTGIGLLKVRNPWGSGEIEDGEFDDDGPGWDKYPEIKKELNPVVADDGIFWVTKEEFFQMYTSIYLSASNMTEFLED